jgi:hypothetical protein
LYEEFEEEDDEEMDLDEMLDPRSPVNRCLACGKKTQRKDMPQYCDEVGEV